MIYKGKKYVTHKELHNKWMRNPAYRKAYEEKQIEFALKRAIIEARLKKGITQKELAEKMGTKQSSIARFESGTYNPTLSFVQKLANALSLKIKIA